MSLADVKHQPHAQRAIQRALTADRLSHAYIFHGPDGTGKESLARGVAEALLCNQPVDRAIAAEDLPRIGVDSLRTGCGKCDDCRLVAALAHPDLHIIYRQLNRNHPSDLVRKRKAIDIVVDVVRHFVVDRVQLTPQRARRKVFVIREADRMTIQAQNALLKTLEEPPADTVLILCVHDVDLLLPTTLSRCQLVRFDALPISFVREKLEESAPPAPADQLDWYAAGSDGSIGRAVERVSDGLFEVNQRVLDGLVNLHKDGSGNVAAGWIEEAKSLGARYKKDDPDITDTEGQRRGLESVFRLTADWFADVLRGHSDDSTIVNSARRADVLRATERTDRAAAMEAVNRIALAERQLERNANTQLVVEVLVADLARAARPRATTLSPCATVP